MTSGNSSLMSKDRRVFLPSSAILSQGAASLSNHFRKLSRTKSRLHFSLPQPSFLVTGPASLHPPTLLIAEVCGSRRKKNEEDKLCNQSGSGLVTVHPNAHTVFSTSFSEPPTPVAPLSTEHVMLELPDCASNRSQDAKPLSSQGKIDHLSRSLPAKDGVLIAKKSKSVRKSSSFSFSSFPLLNFSMTFRPINHFRKDSKDLLKVSRPANPPVPPSRNKLRRRPPPIMTQIPNEFSGGKTLFVKRSASSAVSFADSPLHDTNNVSSDNVQILSIVSPDEIKPEDGENICSQSISPTSVRVQEPRKCEYRTSISSTTLPPSPCSSEPPTSRNRRMGLDIHDPLESAWTASPMFSTNAATANRMCGRTIPEIPDVIRPSGYRRRGSLNARRLSIRLPVASLASENSPIVFASSVWTEVSPTDTTTLFSLSNTDTARTRQLNEWGGDVISSSAAVGQNSGTSSHLVSTTRNLSREKDVSADQIQANDATDIVFDAGIQHQPLPPLDPVIDSLFNLRPLSTDPKRRRRSNTFHGVSQSLCLPVRPDTPFADIFGVNSSAQADEDDDDEDGVSEEREGPRATLSEDKDDASKRMGKTTLVEGSGKQPVAGWSRLKSPQSLQDLVSIFSEQDGAKTKNTKDNSADEGVARKAKRLVTRKEKKQGWCGEWNQGDMQDVIKKLRMLR